MQLVLLDRDGVINQDSKNFIKSPDEWIPIPNSAEAIAMLNQFSYKVAIVTNQSGISRHYFTIHDLNLIHSKMLKVIKSAGGNIEGIWFCPHQAEDCCECRKPKPGLVLDIFKRLNVGENDEVYLVGDSLRDLQCIDAVGGTPVLVLTGKGKKTLAEEGLPENTLVYEDLWSFAQDLCLNQEKNQG